MLHIWQRAFKLRKLLEIYVYMLCILQTQITAQKSHGIDFGLKEDEKNDNNMYKLKHKIFNKEHILSSSILILICCR